MHSPLPHTTRVARIPTLAPQSLPDASAAAPITTPRFEVIDLDRTTDAAVRALAAALRRAPRDLNGRGQRAATLLREGVEHAVLRERDHVVELGVLQPGDESSRALALNDAGQVVGLSRRGLHEHAFLWQSGRLWPLGDLRDPCVDRSRPVTPLQSSRARDINGRGQVVGRAATEDRVFGFLWSFWDGLLDLGELLQPVPGEAPWHVVDARHIDDQGRILATAVCDGRYRDVLLRPSPPALASPHPTFAASS
jgi:probable HAF family extracellular repeat protein